LGGASINFTQSLGFCTMLNPLGVRQWDATKVEESFGSSEVPLFEQAEANGTLHDYEDELYGEKGLLSESRLAMAGGGERTTFYSSISYKNEDGIVKNTGYQKL